MKLSAKFACGYAATIVIFTALLAYIAFSLSGIGAAGNSEAASLLAVALIGGGVAVVVGVILGMLAARGAAPLNDLLATLAHETGSVIGQAQQFTSIANTLSGGAQTNASRQDAISASLDGLSATTKSNVEDMATANGLMDSVLDAAKRLDKSMQDLSGAMEKISASGGEINKIIKTIDDIAAQTNLLALNAAVEAARAGDAGKGFAVVAEEVRNLAGRSAEAARSTTGLIEATIGNIKYGSEIVGATVEEFNLIETQSEKVAQFMRNVSEASNKAASNVAQIASAMEEMETVTQTNAAVAEETNSAAAELISQADNSMTAVRGLGILVQGKNWRDAGERRVETRRAAAPVKPASPPRQPRALTTASAAPAASAAPEPKKPKIPFKQYEWTADLETGNELIDSQHKQLIQAINDLLRACASGEGRAVIADTMDFLESYTAKHFGEEEELQRQFAYPDVPQHHLLHNGFKKVVATISRELQKEGATVEMVMRINRDVAGWLINHIKKEDTKVAAHIKQQLKIKN
ncbi:MAG: bacteriohemerythrin [Planctomycetota bacterium]|jgi:methyl-accepting chemotaxis protein|nr:bacteriohemerythrin [Planctomycetota bacterium]